MHTIPLQQSWQTRLPQKQARRLSSPSGVVGAFGLRRHRGSAPTHDTQTDKHILQQLEVIREAALPALGGPAPRRSSAPRSRIVAKTFADPVMDAPDVDADEEAKRYAGRRCSCPAQPCSACLLCLPHPPLAPAAPIASPKTTCNTRNTRSCSCTPSIPQPLHFPSLAPSWDPSKLTAVVVGAGPTGCLAAHYLAMRGYRVAVVEKGPRPQPGDAASSPLVLTSR